MSDTSATQKQPGQPLLHHTAYASLEVYMPISRPRIAPCYHARDRDRAVTDVEEQQYGSNHQSQPGPHLAGEEVRGSQHVHVDPDELLPGYGRLSFRRWGSMGTLEDVAHRLVTDGIAEFL